MKTLPDFDQLWDYDNPAETEKKFRQLLPAAQSSGIPSYYAELLTQIARTQSLQRQFEAAHQTLDDAERLIESEMRTTRIRYLLERGRTYNSSGHPDQARPLFQEAWELGIEVKEDFYAIDAAHMIAIVEKGDESIAWNHKALELAEISRDPRAKNWRGSLYNNLGWTHHDRGEYEKALNLFQKAIIFRREQADPKLIRIARWCVARCLRSMNEVEQAYEIQKALLAEAEESGEDDGYTHEELAECLLLMGKPDQAQPHFAEAYYVLSKDPWLADHEPERIARLKSLGKVAD